MCYGSSLGLMSRASTLINDEFSSDPTKDWRTSRRRGRDLVFVVVDVLRETAASPPNATPTEKYGIACAARLMVESQITGALDVPGSQSDSTPRAPRLILDYIHTAASHRGKGYASLVIRWIDGDLRRSYPAPNAPIAKADFLVVAIEASLPYWTVNHGFVLEQCPHLRKQINCFTDTVLLKKGDNVAGSLVGADLIANAMEGAEEDAEDEHSQEVDLARSHDHSGATMQNNLDAYDLESSEEEEEEEKEENDTDSNAFGEDSDDAAAREEEDLQMALALSMPPQGDHGHFRQPQRGEARGQSARTEDPAEEEQIEWALAMSMQQK